jgi:hypothetical protein
MFLNVKSVVGMVDTCDIGHGEAFPPDTRIRIHLCRQPFLNVEANFGTIGENATTVRTVNPLFHEPKMQPN